eukprot:CAMPEP_0170563666 /NCGR_PEP_ID=MMETSP0211-20121228/68081_1 /TAXON_ID=311385 /ORGANISM="Pseudokeronopsis sp., Strain OXSARD2" /LENGTH=32 /DNA_ID= /DNA_START= /DNA_END= /DNA_ORIENTATION=
MELLFEKVNKENDDKERELCRLRDETNALKAM